MGSSCSLSQNMTLTRSRRRGPITCACALPYIHAKPRTYWLDERNAWSLLTYEDVEPVIKGWAGRWDPCCGPFRVSMCIPYPLPYVSKRCQSSNGSRSITEYNPHAVREQHERKKKQKSNKNQRCTNVYGDQCNVYFAPPRFLFAESARNTCRCLHL